MYLVARMIETWRDGQTSVLRAAYEMYGRANNTFFDNPILLPHSTEAQESSR